MNKDYIVSETLRRSNGAGPHWSKWTNFKGKWYSVVEFRKGKEWDLPMHQELHKRFYYRLEYYKILILDLQ